jgi:urea-proton symporter
VKAEGDDNSSTNSSVEIKDLDSVTHPYPPQELKRMNRAATLAAIFSTIVGLVTWVVWPLPLYRDYIFNKPVWLPFTVIYRSIG